jgi:hypothetical protein
MSIGFLGLGRDRPERLGSLRIAPGRSGSTIVLLHNGPNSAAGCLNPAFRDWNIEAEPARVRCPLLAIQGHDGESGTMQQPERIGAGHDPACPVPQRDQPDAVSAAIERHDLAHRRTPS